MNKFADVILPLPLGELTYSIPPLYQGRLNIGSGVLVSLRRSKILLAIVVKLHNTTPAYCTKALLTVLYPQPICTPQQLAFLAWIANYYLVSFGRALSMGLPKALYPPHNICFKINYTDAITQQIYLEKLGYTALHTQPIPFAHLVKKIGNKEAHNAFGMLLSQGWIEALPIASMQALNKHSRYTIPLEPLAILTAVQNNALLEIQEQFAKKTAVLLYGVIGSGKTELYMHLIEEILLQQKQVLLLVPEISLLTHIVDRLKPFQAWLTVYHSKQSTKARLTTWARILHEPALLIVGTRSALFLPFKDLQLIIVDEEHDMAYKHTDSAPTYHTRDSCILLAQHHQAKVLLSSGTPSIESYYNTKRDKFGLVTLYHRFGATSYPKLLFIDLNVEKKSKTIRDHFSLTLLTALQKNYEEGGQAMVFQNKRGYARYLICASCRWVPCCHTCAVSLTYHQDSHQLLCHYCGYAVPPYKLCSCCGSSQLHNIGFGTEKVEATLQLFFPEQRIVRMDLDSTKRKNACQAILAQVTSGSAAILVGTQMIAKGLDFANIRLIGVLDIDGLLYFPDFRSNEKSFQLITQLAGRAGRRNHPGTVFIQTAQPHHPLFHYLTHGNYQEMYQEELAERKKFFYPPYSRLIKIVLSCIDEIVLKSGAIELKIALQEQCKDNVIGPQQPLVGKIRNCFLLHLLIKLSPNSLAQLQRKKALLQSIAQKIIGQKVYKTVHILWDVDPI